MKKLLIATNNPGKLRELGGMLAGLDVELIGLDGLSAEEVEETGSTFLENARLKAAGYATASRLVSIADDSGLVVDALDGRPGVLSARYGGEGLAFDQKMEKLLGELERTVTADRHARFISAVAVADVDGQILSTAEGKCEGRIARSPRGTRGFGYDPIFIPEGFDMTFGELSDEVKAKISHRAAAFREIIPFLRDFIAN